MKKIRAGFQGVSGSFSEEALYAYFSENDLEAKAVPEFEDICIALENKDIDYGILPVENSSTGAITQVYDLLSQHEVFIVGEICLKVKQHLLALPGTKLDEIEEVYSHPQAFEQCRPFLKQYPWRLIPYYNTARSAELIKTSQYKAKGAIGSRKAAELYGLEILKEAINSNRTNTTRFIILSNELRFDENANKISVMISTKHTAGSLYHALKHFAENQINMLKIESRPIPDKSWEYYFYVDFEGNLNEEVIQTAINNIKQDTEYLKILGNYQKFEE